MRVLDGIAMGLSRVGCRGGFGWEIGEGGGGYCETRPDGAIAVGVQPNRKGCLGFRGVWAEPPRMERESLFANLLS